MSFFGEMASSSTAAGKTKFLSILRRSERSKPIETTPNPPDQLDIPCQSEKGGTSAVKKKRLQLPEGLKRRIKSMDMRKRATKKDTSSSTEVLEAPAPPKNDFSALMPKHKTPREERFEVLDSSLKRVEEWHADMNEAEQANSAARSKILQELQEAEKSQILPKDPLSEEDAAKLAQASREAVKSGLSDGQVFGDQFLIKTDKVLPADPKVRLNHRAAVGRSRWDNGTAAAVGDKYAKDAYDKAFWHDQLLPEVRKTVDRTTTSYDDIVALHRQQERLMNYDKVRKMSLAEFEAKLAAFEAKTSAKAKEQVLTTYHGGPYGSSWVPKDELMNKQRDAFQKEADAAFEAKHVDEEWSSDQGVRAQYRTAKQKHREETHRTAWDKYPTLSPFSIGKDGKFVRSKFTYDDIGHQTGPGPTSSSFDFFSGDMHGGVNDNPLKHQQALQKLWNAHKNLSPKQLETAATAQKELETYPEWQAALKAVESGEVKNTNGWFIQNWRRGVQMDPRAIKLWRTTYDNSPNGIYEQVVKARSNPAKYTADQEYTGL